MLVSSSSCEFTSDLARVGFAGDQIGWEANSCVIFRSMDMWERGQAAASRNTNEGIEVLLSYKNDAGTTYLLAQAQLDNNSSTTKHHRYEV